MFAPRQRLDAAYAPGLRAAHQPFPAQPWEWQDRRRRTTVPYAQPPSPEAASSPQEEDEDDGILDWDDLELDEDAMNDPKIQEQIRKFKEDKGTAEWGRAEEDVHLEDAEEIAPGDLRAPYERHTDLDGRMKLADIPLNSDIVGTVTAQLLWHGIMVDIGAEFDGLIAVHELDMFDVRDVLKVGSEVVVRATKVYAENPKRFVFPVELDVVRPDISEYRLEKPRTHAPIRIFTEEMQDGSVALEGLAAEVGRPLAQPGMGGGEGRGLDMESILRRGAQSKRTFEPRQPNSINRAPPAKDDKGEYEEEDDYEEDLRLEGSSDAPEIDDSRGTR